MKHLLHGYRLAVCVVLALSSGLAPGGRAQPVEEAKVRAAMTLQLLSFTEWPDSTGAHSDDPVAIGVLGGKGELEPFHALLKDPVYASRFEVRSISADATAEELRQLEALFFPKRGNREIAHLILRARGLPIVLIGAFDGFLEMGGMVNFVTRQRRLGFEIHLPHATENGIAFRAKLLRLANRVVEE